MTRLFSLIDQPTLKRRTRLNRLGYAIAASSMVVAIEHSAIAAQSTAGLEEIVVTAQKREQTLSEVPISVGVVDASRMRAGNINKIADLSEFLPNMSMTETAASTQLYVRGIGSGNNQGFEQSVGQYIDGIYYGRQQLLRMPFLDLQRVEVLRGPQSILFGKNSIAGALNLTSARPTDEFEARLDSLHEFESDQREYTAIVSGPLTDDLRARLAYRSYEEDGFIRNTLKNADEPQRDEDAVRLTIDGDLTEAFSASLKVEHDNFDTHGRQFEIVLDEPNLFPPGSSPLAGLNLAGAMRVLGQPVLESAFNFQRQVNAAEFSNSDVDNQTLTLTYDLDNYTLTSVSGRVKYETEELCDCDYTPANIFEGTIGENYEQFSQELRLSSTSRGRFEWLLGVYLQDTKMNSEEGFNVYPDSLLRTVAAITTNPQQRLIVNLLGTRIERQNEHKSDMQAAFFQGTWTLADELRLTLGGRFNQEDRSAFREINVLDLATGTITRNPLAPLVYVGSFKIYSEQVEGRELLPGVILPGHSLRGERRETQFTPLVGLQWDVNDQSMLYVSATNGYKAGGFDARANNPFSFEFQQEKATSVEVGNKSRLFNGSLELNAALFYTDYEDLQISQFDGTLGFNVGNAKGTKVRGIELDGRWAATDELTVSYAYSWLDFEFTDFRNGNCYNRQVSTIPPVNGARLCDYTGLRGQYTPEHSANLAFDHRYSLGNNLALASSLMFSYRDEQNVHDNLDPKLQIPASSRIHLRIGLEAENWQLAFVGKNLTEEKVLTYSGNVPLSANTFGTNTFYGFVDRGRQLALEASYIF
ncbi:MAG: TonB-dependent receptor [Pseudomonadota bacterium]